MNRFLKIILLLTITVSSLSFTNIPTASASLTDGLVGHWTFDEGSGTTAGDSAGSNNGTLTNGPTWIEGKIGNRAISFDGSNDYINTGMTGNLGDKITISAWVNFANAGGHDRDIIVGSRYFADGEFVLEQHNAAGVIMFTSGNGHYAQWRPPYTPGEWGHIVLVIDTTQSTNTEKVKLYWNNAVTNQVAFAGITTDSIVVTSPIKIGGATPGPGVISFFAGKMDDVRIYNRPLSLQEVGDLYNFRSVIEEDSEPISEPPPIAETAPLGTTEWYASPSGSETGNGTVTSPWDLQTALNHPTSVKSGHIIWLRGGTYVGIDQPNSSNILTKKLFASKLKGTKQDPIIVRGYSTERATIDGAIESTGEWTTFWGFEITNSDSVNRTGCPKDRSGGLNLLARGNKAINMIIHDGGHPGIGFWNPVGDGGELYGNIMWANGIYDTCDGGTAQNPNTRGSGFYMQNNTGTRYVHDNISFWNFTTGMKAYGNNTDGFEFEGNVVFNNPYENLFVTANGAPTKRLRINNNYTFQERDKASGNVGLGIYFPGVYDPGVDVIIQNNYLATGDIIPWPQNGNYPAAALKIADFSDVTVTNNTLVGGIMADLLVTSRLTNLNWNNNTYYSTRTAHPNYPFLYRSVPAALINPFFDGWKTACNCDSNSTYTSGLPTTNAIFVRPNKYEQGRAHIVVYNWQNLSSVNVNVSNVLGVGDSYEVRDAQNYFGTPATSGTYSGGEISIPMNLTAVSVPIGNIVTSSAHTSSQFGAFVIIRTSSSGNSPVQQPIPDPITSPTNASCSTRVNRCTTGTVFGRTSNTTHNLWTCTGLNGGTNASCSILKTAQDPVNPIVPVDPLPTPATPPPPTYTPAYTPVHTPTSYTYKKPTTPKPIAGTPDLPPSPSFEPLDFIPTDYIQILLDLIKQFFIDLTERIKRGINRIIG